MMVNNLIEITVNAMKTLIILLTAGLLSFSAVQAGVQDSHGTVSHPDSGATGTDYVGDGPSQGGGASTHASSSNNVSVSTSDDAPSQSVGHSSAQGSVYPGTGGHETAQSSADTWIAFGIGVVLLCVLVVVLSLEAQRIAAPY